MAGAAGGHIPNFADYQYGGLRTTAGYNVSKAEVANLNALFDSLNEDTLNSIMQRLRLLYYYKNDKIWNI